MLILKSYNNPTVRNIFMVVINAHNYNRILEQFQLFNKSALRRQKASKRETFSNIENLLNAISFCPNKKPP